MSGDGFIPGRGDLLWILFGRSPESGDVFGHEQQGRRPAFCLSPYDYNEQRGMAVVCPVSSRIKGFERTEVRLPPGLLDRDSVVLVDQVRAIDWRVRKGQLIGACPFETVHEVLRKLRAITG